ncbi:MAG: Trk system potassium transporter TrkA [Thermoplasmata archaeon]|nr:Trk system potassium transporter TrkA [Thermoplasmata archaeon]
MKGKDIVIAGAGERGISLAKMLIAEGHNVTIIEQEGEVAEKVSDLDALIIRGNAASRTTQEKAYVKNADYFIAVTGSDEINIIACSLAKSENCKTFARVNSYDYITEPISTSELKKVGVDVAFCPDLLTAKHMANIISTTNMFNTSPIARGKVVVVDASVKEGSKTRGKSIKELKLPRGCNVVAVFRGDEVIIPHGETRVQENDRLLFLIEKGKDLQKVLASLGKLVGKPRQYPDERRISKVMVAGASRIGVHLCKLLEEKDFSIVLIEEDEKKCQKASEELKKTLIINGSYTDRELLLEEGIETADVFLALTEREEVNILTSIMARQYGARHSVALVDRPGLKTILEDVGIDVIISQRWVTVDAIMRYIHREDFESLSTLDQGDTHMVEVKVRKNCPFADKKLAKIKDFKSHNVIVAAIRRGEKIIIPRGEQKLEVGDQLILFTKSSSLGWIARNFRGREEKKKRKLFL